MSRVCKLKDSSQRKLTQHDGDCITTWVHVSKQFAAGTIFT